jgi:FdhE protein
MNSGTEHHLKEVYSLYNKVLQFVNDVELEYKYNPLEDTFHHYIKDDIEKVLNAFSEVFELSSSEANELKETMRKGRIDFLKFINDEKTMLEGQFPLLYILSRPFFQSLKSSVNVDNIYWQDGRCPVCRAAPALSIIEKESKRKYYCTFCGSLGSYQRIGCPYCKNTDSKQMNILFIKDNDDIRIDVCSSCKSYVKSFMTVTQDNHVIEEMDIKSIALDIVAQNKGYNRRSPNPIGMVVIK